MAPSPNPDDLAAPRPWRAEHGMVARLRSEWESLQVSRLFDGTVVLTLVKGDVGVFRCDLSPDAANHLAAMLDGRASALNEARR